MSKKADPFYVVAVLVVVFGGWWLIHASSSDAEKRNEAERSRLSQLDYRAQLAPARQEDDVRRAVEDERRIEKQLGIRTWNGDIGVEEEYEIIKRDVKMEHGMSFEDARRGKHFSP